MAGSTTIGDGVSTIASETTTVDRTTSVAGSTTIADEEKTTANGATTYDLAVNEPWCNVTH